MNIIKFASDVIKNHGVDTLVIAVVIALMWFVFVTLVKRGRKDLVYKFVLSMVVNAELKLGGKTGDFKEAEVVTHIYQLLPVWLRFVFSKDDIASMIDKAVEHLKKYLKNDGDLLGYVDENYQVVINQKLIE